MKIQCLNCKDIIESKFRHDFQTCTCFQEASKAQSQLTEIYETAKAALKSEDLIETLTTNYHTELQKLNKGVYIDGGKDYTRIGGDMTNYRVINPKNEGK